MVVLGPDHVCRIQKLFILDSSCIIFEPPRGKTDNVVSEQV